MLLELAQRAPVQRVVLPEWAAHGVEVALWRLDLIDAAAPGNKLFKLAKNFRAARVAGFRRVLSFGGAFSNHIHALALCGSAQGFETIGIIRGESSAAENPTLRDARAAGMQLHFVDRKTYRLLTGQGETDDENRQRVLYAELQQHYGPCFIIPEGGANRLGVLGCRPLGEAISRLAYLPDHVTIPCATGSTLAGIAAGLENRCALLGIAVLKGGGFIAEQVRAQLRDIGAWHCTNWQIDIDSHTGGYARVPAALRQFVARFNLHTESAIEPVYSGKMLYAIHNRIERGEFARGSRILAVHTGGMQGARGFGESDKKNQRAVSSLTSRPQKSCRERAGATSQ
ncbi:MAG TPA: pyridoxal-phosphate dependent enzyme [Spongiibacteraceae bacterium]|jgi:1-aminocyclopropane-1-carboxylate deaminase